MGEQNKNMLIGIFVIVSCMTVIWLIMFLKPTVGDGKQTLYVRFANINQINLGTRVLFAGKPVGEVVAIEEVHEARKAHMSDVLGEIYYFQLVLKIDSSVHVYDTDEVTVQTSGLLGEKSVAIIPKIPPKGVTPKLITNQPIYAQSVDPIENAFNELSGLSKEMKTTFQMTSSWIQKNGNDLGNTIRSFGSAMEEIHLIAAKVNEQNLVDDFQASIRQFTTTAQDIDATIQQMKTDNVFTNAATMMDNLKTTSQNVNTLTTNLSQGKGTLGKLLSDDDFYLHMSSVLSKADTVMNDINHYGILFHLNKSWQRQRAQEITTLNALDSPRSFKTYFQKEVSEINMAMSRLSLLIDKAEKSPKKEEILNSEKFRKDFKDLLLQAKGLSENLTLYNEQLMDSTKAE